MLARETPHFGEAPAYTKVVPVEWADRSDGLSESADSGRIGATSRRNDGADRLYGGIGGVTVDGS